MGLIQNVINKIKNVVKLQNLMSEARVKSFMNISIRFLGFKQKILEFFNTLMQ